MEREYKKYTNTWNKTEEGDWNCDTCSGRNTKMGWIESKCQKRGIVGINWSVGFVGIVLENVPYYQWRVVIDNIVMDGDKNRWERMVRV